MTLFNRVIYQLLEPGHSEEYGIQRPSQLLFYFFSCFVFGYLLSQRASKACKSGAWGGYQLTQ